MKVFKRFMCYVMSLLLMVSSLVVFDVDGGTSVKASEYKVLDVYEASYFNYFNAVNGGTPFAEYDEYEDSNLTALNTYSKMPSITNSITWYSLDGNWCLRADSSAKSLSLYQYNYQGSDFEMIYDIPDAVVFHYSNSKEAVKINNKIDHYTIHTTQTDEIVVTGLSTAFSRSRDKSTCASYTISVPSRVTRLENNAFLNNTKVTAIDFKGDIQAIGTSAFEGCTRLVNMNLTGVLGSVATNTIPARCFYQCSSLENISIPDTILNIGESAFYQCNKIDYLLLSDSIKSIGKNAFAMCSNLRYLYIKSDYQDWTKAKIVADNELHKLVLGADKEPMVVNKGETVSIGDNIYGASTLAVISKVDIVPETAYVVCDSKQDISFTIYDDTTYGYTTKGLYFYADAKGSYTVYAEDVLGNSVTKIFSYNYDVEDVTPPVIKIDGTGTASKSTYQNVKITWEDADTYVSTVTFDGKVISDGSVECDEEGVHEIVVKDVAGNEATKSFLIDRTEPTVKGVTNFGYYKNGVTIDVTDSGAGVKSIILDGKDVTNSASITSYTAGDHKLEVTDWALNKLSWTFNIDQQGPRLKDVVSGGVYNKDVTIHFLSGCGIKEASAKFKGFDKVSETYTLYEGYVLSKEGTYTVSLVDALNNKFTYYITIDKTAPVLDGVAQGKYYNVNTVKVYITDNTKVKTVVNGNSYTSSTITITDDGRYTVTATDEAGNVSKVSFVKDTTVPAISGMKEGKKYTKSMTVSVKDNTDISYISVNSVKVRNGYKIEKSGAYTVKVVDKSGNSSKVSFEIDNLAPTTNITSGKAFKKKSVKVTFSDDYSGLKKATLDGKTVKSGVTVKKEGVHKLVLVDNWKNERVVKFYIDRKKPTVNIKKNAVVKKGTKITAKDGISGVKKLTLNGKKIKNKSKVKADGKYKLVVTDKAGNKLTVSFKVDSTAPKANVNSGDEVKKGTKLKVSDSITGVKSIKLNGKTVKNGVKLTKKGRNTLVVKDKAGNSKKITFKVK